MNMKTNYLKLNSWAVAALMGMCSLAACSDDNSGEGGGNGDSEEVIANNGTLKGSVDGSKTVILTKGYKLLPRRRIYRQSRFYPEDRRRCDNQRQKR